MAENEAQGEWALPGGWVWATLEEIADLFGGGTPSREIPEYFDGDIVWLTPTQIPKDRITVVSDSQERITEEALRKSSARLLPAGTVLMTSRASIGYVAIAGTEVTTNQGFASFVCQEGVYNFYLAYWLWSNADVFIQQATGTTFKEISKSKLRPFRFPLAPLPEQRRIVAEIETQFTRLEAAVAALERVQANLRRYKAAVLKAACEGRLVPTEAEMARAEGRDYEPADQLLTRFLAERRARWEAEHPGKRYQEPEPPDTESLPELPEGWAWATVEQISEMTQYGTSEKANLDPTGIPVLRMGNIQDGELDFSNLKYFPFDWPKLDDFVLQNGDVLFNRTNSAELVGKTATYKRFHPRAVFASYLIRVRTHYDYLPDLLSFYINSFYGLRYIASVVSQQVGQANVSGTKLSRMPVVLPPIAEQHRVVAEVERRLSVVAALEASVVAALARGGRLRQAVLKQAFEGRLVPQDPDDEPASALLERIKAEKARRERKSNRRAQLKQMELF